MKVPRASQKFIKNFINKILELYVYVKFLKISEGLDLRCYQDFSWRMVKLTVYKENMMNFPNNVWFGFERNTSLRDINNLNT